MSETKFPSLLMLEVADGDIRGGTRGDSASCALAKALLRQTGATEVFVTDFDDIEVYVKDEYGDYIESATYVGPKAITGYLDRFDGYGSGESARFRVDVKPTTFRLRRKSHYTPEPHVPEMR